MSHSINTFYFKLPIDKNLLETKMEILKIFALLALLIESMHSQCFINPVTILPTTTTTTTTSPRNFSHLFHGRRSVKVDFNFTVQGIPILTFYSN